jgi:hypothetical protein
MTAERKINEITSEQEFFGIYLDLPNETYSAKELEIISINHWEKNLTFFNPRPKFQIQFTFQDKMENILAAANFEYGKFIDIQWPKKFGIAGKKVTMNIGIVAKHHVLNALNCHFGRTKYSESFKSPDINLREEYPCAFKRNMDLLYSIVNITDGMNVNGKEENSLKAGAELAKDGKYYGGNYSEHINNNMLLRTLTQAEDNKFIPYHSFFITNEIIQEAYNTLALEPLAQLLLWYFPEERIPGNFDKHDKKIIREEMVEWGWLKRSCVVSEYHRAWRQKQLALNDLRLRIITLLHQ